MGGILASLALPEVQTLGMTAIAAVFGFFKRRAAVKKYNLERAMQCLESGVQTVYDEYVRVLKNGADDGKLTDIERRQARDLAVQKAKEYAASDGIDLAKIYAADYLPVLVENLIKKSKAA